MASRGGDHGKDEEKKVAEDKSIEQDDVLRVFKRFVWKHYVLEALANVDSDRRSDFFKEMLRVCRLPIEKLFKNGVLKHGQLDSLDTLDSRTLR